MPRNQACDRCSLHAGVQNVCVWSESQRTTTGGVMLVAEAPGAEEDAQGRPFMGAAGKQLEVHLQAVGKTRGDVILANAVKCRPPGNRTPLAGEVAACWPYLAEEIDTWQPSVILCLGGTSLKALTGLDSVKANRGKAVLPKKNVRVGDAQIFVTYHPAATLHNRNKVEQQRIVDAIRQDLQLAFRIADDTSNTEEHKRAILPDGYTTAQLQKALSVFDDTKVVAADLEWSALEDRKISWPWSKGAELFSISFTGKIGPKKYRSVAFSWPPPPGGMEVLQEFFARMPMFFHNALSDLNWLSSVGLKVRLAGDTMLLGFLIDEEQRLALEQLAQLYTNVKPNWKVNKWARRPQTREAWVRMLEYNADDTFATFLLIYALLEEVAKKSEKEAAGIRRVYQHLLLKIVPVFVKMALRGVPMDLDLLDEEYQLSLSRADALEDEIADIIGCTRQQARSLAMSPQQTTRYLKGAYGLEIEASNKEELQGLEEYPVVALIQKDRWERNKVQGTYVGPWRDLIREQGDGRLHSVYRLTYARTGRTSAEIERGGSLQLVPRDDPRRALKPRRIVRAKPGRYVGAADQSQAEIRVAAWFANERTMLQLYREGADLHTATAAFIKVADKVPLEVFWPNRAEYMALVTKQERQDAKGVNFGLLYGMQVESLIAYCKMNYGVTLTWEQAERAHKAYFRLYGDLDAWHRHCAQVILPRGYTETPFGRYRRNLKDERTAINTPVQATASDLTLISMAQIDQRFEEKRMSTGLIGFVHDSVLFEGPWEEANEAKQIVVWEMEHPDCTLLGVPKIPVPLKADVKVGQSWAEE